MVCLGTLPPRPATKLYTFHTHTCIYTHVKNTQLPQELGGHHDHPARPPRGCRRRAAQLWDLLQLGQGVCDRVCVCVIVFWLFCNLCVYTAQQYCYKTRGRAGGTDTHVISRTQLHKHTRLHTQPHTTNTVQTHTGLRLRGAKGARPPALQQDLHRASRALALRLAA